MAQGEDRVSLKEKLGQMVMVGFRGFEIGDDSPISADIENRYLGGVILFDRDLALNTSERNIKNPEQVKKLVAQLQARSQSTLLIGIDYEGGFVTRLKAKYGFPETLSALKMAELPEEQMRVKCAAMASTLAELGFNINFAPVVDLNLNPDLGPIGKYERSYSADPGLVTSRAAIAIDAYRAKKIMTSLKHFPGHGSAKGDTHLELVDVTKTWTDRELDPYRALIRAGRVDTVMTAHVFNSRWGEDAPEEEYPATLSPHAIPRLLREKLAFDGVVFSDDMQMGAIAKNYGLEEAIRLAVNADVDILVFGNNVSFDEAIASRVITILTNLVERGEITQARIDRSYRRIVALKKKLESQ